MLKLFMRLDRLRSRPWLLRAGEAPLGDRCKPALMAAAACSDDKEGDLGDGGLLRKESAALLSEILRGRCWRGEPGVEGGREVGSEFRSGGIVEI